MKKEFIKNRKGQKIAIIAELKPSQKGLAFVMHGLGGTKDQPIIKTFAEAFYDSGYTVVRFDTTNTFGESNGDYEDATTTNYLEDLEDVIKWAGHQRWYQEPFCLAGHSLGGICVSLYAQKHPQKVKYLAPISTVVSGKLVRDTYLKEEFSDNQKNIEFLKTSDKVPEKIKKLKMSHFEDWVKYNYDLLTKVEKLKMPVLLIVGDKDDITPPKHQKIFYKKMPQPKEFHIIKDAPHTFEDKKHLKEIKKIFINWIKKHD